MKRNVITGIIGVADWEKVEQHKHGGWHENIGCNGLPECGGYHRENN